MKYKKFFSCLLAMGLVCSNVVAFASEPIAEELKHAVRVEEVRQNSNHETMLTQEEAEKLLYGHIKSFFNIDLGQKKEGTQSYIEFREDWYDNTSTWQLSVNINEKDKYLYVYAIISDETGELMSVRKHEGYQEEAGNITQFTFDEAKAIAYNFLKSKKPEVLKELSKEPLNESYYMYQYLGSQGLYPREYRVFFERQHEGTPFINEGISIGVNSGTGEVVSYEYRWSDKKVPTKNGIISEEEARKIFQEAIDFKLNYLPASNGYYDQPINDVKLVYTPDAVSSNLIDANTGDFLDQYQQIGDRKVIDVKASEKESFKNLTKKKPNREKEMTKEEALKVATDVLNKIYKDVKIEGTNYFSSYGYNNTKTWNIEFVLGNNRYNRGRITINAMTEEITGINYYNWAMREMMMGEGDFTPALQWEEAYQKAVDIIKELYPDKLKDVTTEQTFIESFYYVDNVRMQNLEYHFNFTREANGIQFPYNNIRVSFDTITGQLQNLDYRWDDITLPKPEGLIDKRIPLELFTEQTELELAYGLIPSATPYEKVEQEFKLVYRIKPKNQFLFQNVDAKTGKLLDFRGEEVREEKQKLESVAELLKGHWAERELTIMHDNGVIDLQNFNLADVLPKKEVIRIIVNATGNAYYYGNDDLELKFTDLSSEDSYYNDIKMAVRQGIIENEEVAFNGENPVTREELAVMLVKMGRLEKLASVENIYTLPVEDVADITPEYLGHTAIAYGLEVIGGTGERYEPKEKVTLEQVAVSVYRGFKKLLNILR
ncbi:S-layer homology domain-containing protein [Alkaliphilus transvaalensis]|uniref:S-layer homology domain-containing protein n=1 Tax=Alkaliphilus transvaalensis TaxID=114628 RepID=UPI00047BEC3F|nr:S-layer homology domain-containing protein [Alkaliphilus transvaalensis]